MKKESSPVPRCVALLAVVALVATAAPCVAQELVVEHPEDDDAVIIDFDNPPPPPGNESDSMVVALQVLRWLASTQHEDGTWGDSFPLDTALPLLCFLGYNEPPFERTEFGLVVRKALVALIDRQNPDGTFGVTPADDIAHPIATAALCLAFCMTRHPMVMDASVRAMPPLLRLQRPDGSWPDTVGHGHSALYAAWAAEAIYAAWQADFEELPGMGEIRRRTGEAIANAADGDPADAPLRAGALMLLGESRNPATERVLKSFENWKIGLAADGKSGVPSVIALPPEAGTGFAALSRIRFANVAMFHAGGERWRRWIKMQFNTYPSAQIVVPADRSGYVDNRGHPCSIGHYEIPGGTGNALVDTCLTGLLFEVFYPFSHMPKFTKP